ncbi:MAG: Alanine racemase 1 [Firmicutes bacterium]|nr:Alanine racemase 1 [Bacillota bacterium]
MAPIRSTVADIVLDHIAHNVQAVRGIIPARTELMAVVKADAYGHGAIEVASLALSAGATRLGVAVLDEAIELRRAGIAAPIHILGYVEPECAEQVVKLGLTATAYDRESVLALSGAATRLARKVKVHVEIDTGMGRLGVRPQDAVGFAELAISLPHLEVEGVFSHLACADAADLSSARGQITAFHECCMRLESRGHRLTKHIANTAAILALRESHLDMVRLGLGLYGMYPAPYMKSLVKLHPAMSLRSRLSHVKWVEDKTPIGYGWTYRAAGQRLIATVPIGYADGYSRRLSNVGQALVAGQRVPLVGRVCMDQCMFDVTGLAAKTGDEIVLLGRAEQDEITVDEVAAWMGTINYEVTCLISRRVARVFWRNNVVSGVRSLLGRMH